MSQSFESVKKYLPYFFDVTTNYYYRTFSVYPPDREGPGHAAAGAADAEPLPDGSRCSGSGWRSGVKTFEL